MGIDFRSLFESTKDKNKREKKEARQRKRKLKNLLSGTEANIQSLNSDLEGCREEARKFLTAGQKGAAMQSMQAYRNTLSLIQKLRTRKFVIETNKANLEMAQTDQESVSILSEIANALEIDPEEIADKLEDVEDKIEEQEAVDEIFEEVYQKQLATSGKVSDALPSVEDLMSDLEAEINGGQAKKESGESDEIDQLRNDLDDLENGNDGADE